MSLTYFEDLKKRIRAILDEANGKCTCLPCCSCCHCNCHSCLVDNICCCHKHEPPKDPPKFHVGQRVRTTFGKNDHCGTVLEVFPDNDIIRYYYRVKMCSFDKSTGCNEGVRKHGEGLFEAVIDCQCHCQCHSDCHCTCHL